ncbi:ribosome maturation factor RimP [Methylovorus sp. MM2]|uniref:ribosome maturation factor RimP n=1 Tax=Methylovorus sp. MM2 TaxID=1848038 RepID=UPI0007DF78A1|nr:ribosome maturation factor RimP [Methylovorus sp. MM2]OAM51863.1 ribosome maturation factor RimP [Methylovorus sp. MM2]
MQDLYTLLERSVAQLGYELVDLEMSNRGKLLRLFIDKPDGVNIDDCVLVSNQLSNLLAVEHDIDYDRLEVSSPGIDRVLKKESDFLRFVGEKAQVKLRVLVENRKNFLGILRGLEQGELLIECDGVVHKVALTNIDKARLHPDL